MAKKRKYGSGTVRKRSDGRWEARVVIGYDDNGIVYTQNCGYIKEMASLNNGHQHAYVIGVDVPLKTFKGKAIAIINRKNDIEDELIVCDENAHFSKEEILEMVDFQEKNFKTKLISK